MTLGSMIHSFRDICVRETSQYVQQSLTKPVCSSTETACVPVHGSAGADTASDAERTPVFPGVPSAHSSTGPGAGGPAGRRRAHGWLVQRGFQQF